MRVSFVSFAAEPVTVGWGKKATQFHGSLGKPTAETLKAEVSHLSRPHPSAVVSGHASSPQPRGPALPWDDGRPRVSWRGDGEFFACTTVDPTSGRSLHCKHTHSRCQGSCSLVQGRAEYGCGLETASCTPLVRWWRGWSRRYTGGSHSPLCAQ